MLNYTDDFIFVKLVKLTRAVDLNVDILLIKPGIFDPFATR